jgi:hypothetical protein
MSGLVTMTPTSIDHVGTSASINANGGVDFENISELKLNGVFTPDFDNYVMYATVQTGQAQNLLFNYTSGGVEEDTNTYTFQVLYGSNTAVDGVRWTRTYGHLFYIDTNMRSGTEAHFYGPALGKPTAARSTSAVSTVGAYLEDQAITHSVAQPFDGIKLWIGGNTFTGNLIVMGYAE